MPEEADATPTDDMWPKAEVIKVVVEKPNGSQQVHNDVKRITIPWTPGGITVDKKKFPNGVIVLNEMTPPNDQSTISTKDPNNNLILTISRDSTRYVHVVFNSGWPCGEIVLWK